MDKSLNAGSGVPLRSALALLENRDRAKLLGAIALRICANLLDLAALAGVALIAIAISQLAQGKPNQSNATMGYGWLQINVTNSMILAGLVALLFLTKSAIAIRFNLWVGDFVASLEVKAGEKLLERTFALGDKRSKKMQTLPEIQNMLVYSLNSLFTDTLMPAIALLSELTLLLFLLIGFVVVNPLATLGLTVYLSIVVLVLNKFVSRKIKHEAKRSYQAYESLFSKTRDLFHINREAALAGVTAEWMTSITKSQKEHSLSIVRAAHFSSLPRYIVESALILGVFGFIGGVVIFSDLPHQAVTIGIFLTGGLRLTASILPLQAAWNTLKQSSVVAEASYTALLGQFTERFNGGAAKSTSEISAPLGVSVLDVNVTDPEGRFILKNVNIAVEPGTKYAIVGPSGSGKSTLLEIMIGLRQPSSGQVSINDGDREVYPLELDGKIGYVPQKPSLVFGTVRQNITLTAEELGNDTRLAQVIRSAGLLKTIQALSQGVETVLEPDSASLSGGEIQRIGLARALYRRPRLLVLDESTSALDAATEAAISEFLDTQTPEMTTIVVAHRLSTIQNSDKIIYLNEGEVVDEGRFADLVRRQPDFASAAKLMAILK